MYHIQVQIILTISCFCTQSYYCMKCRVIGRNIGCHVSWSLLALWYYDLSMNHWSLSIVCKFEMKGVYIYFATDEPPQIKLLCVTTPDKGRGMASQCGIPQASLVHKEEPYAMVWTSLTLVYDDRNLLNYYIS